MHDPMTVAHQIKSPFLKYGKNGRDEFERKYRETLITIWHVDPERGPGGDDSCGWFMRHYHGDAAILEKIRKEFNYEWDGTGGWFSEDGMPLYSSIAITIAMFRRVAYVALGSNWHKTDRFMKKHLYDIISFAENPVDSMHESITSRWGIRPKAERVEATSQIIYGCFLRWTRPWYKHPRWHVHHWKIQVEFMLQLKRFLFSRCCVCGKGFEYGESPTTYSWNGTGPRWFRSEKGVFHGTCSPEKPASPMAKENTSWSQ